MKKILTALFFLFLLNSCGEEKAFMTSSDTVSVIDINLKEYSVNGNIVGKTYDDIIQVDNLLIKPIDQKLNSLNQEKKGYALHLHLAENLSYDVFHRIVATAGFSGISSIQYVIGDKFKNPFTLYLPSREGNECYQLKMKKHLQLLDDEITDVLVLSNGKLEFLTSKNDKKLQDKRQEIECAEKYMELSLFVTKQNMTAKYEVRLNELGIIGGEKSYVLKNEDELWNLLDDVRSRKELENKIDRKKIVFGIEKNISLKDIVSIITKLTEYGYEISYAALGN
jgi:biopolymer transport protein ExbD